MTGKSITKTVKPRVVPADLEAVVREVVRAAPGLRLIQIRKALPTSYLAFAKEAQATLRQLADRGEVYTLGGKTEIFFECDPLATLDEIVPKRLSAAVLSKSALKKLVHELAPGHAIILDLWLKTALARGIVHEHRSAPASRDKRYGTEPDPRRNLTSVLTALRKALAKTDGLGISRQQVADVLLAELGISPASPQAHSNGAHRDSAACERFLAILQALAAERPRQALLSVRELRARVSLDKEQFDAIALDLMRDGKVSLHHHDHPASLLGPERSELVQDTRGNYYIGIAPGRGK
jgi:hypothetical protein